MRGIALNVNDRVQVDASLATGGVVGSRRGHRPHAGADDHRGAEPDRLDDRCRSCRSTTATSPSSPSSPRASRATCADEVSLGLTSTMSISVNGARRNAVNWLVDGVMNVDVGSNITLLSTPTLESIEQFKIITSSYAAEWPRSGGGIINVVTKSGTSRFCRQRLRVLPQRRAEQQLVLPQAGDRSGDSRQRAGRCDYNNFGFTIGGPVLKSKEKLFFFFSEELRRIKRAPASLTATVPNPEWLTDPTSANYVPAGGARSDRGAAAVRLSGAEHAAAGAGRGRPLPGGVAQHQQHAPGSAPRGLRPQQHAAVVGTLHARPQRDARARRPVLQHRRFPASPAPTPRVPGQVGAVGLRTIIGSNRLNELNYHFSSNNINDRRRPRACATPRSEFGITIPEVFPENAGGLIPVIDVTGLSTLGANQLIRIQYLNHSITRQLLVAARQPRLQDGRPRDLRAEERERRQPQPGRLRVRRDHRRRHGVPELHARQPRRRRAPAAATPRPSATSTCTCASTASSSTRRTRGARPRA